MAYLRLTCYRAFLGMKAFSCYNYVPTLLVVTQSYRAAKKHHTSSVTQHRTSDPREAKLYLLEQKYGKQQVLGH